MHYIRGYDDDNDDDDYRDSYREDYRDNGAEGSSKYYDDGYHPKVPEPPGTKKGAEDVIQEARQDKKFWNYNEVDNSKKLQGAIDILYNCKPGNTYLVEFNDNQTGTRLIINCKTCNKILSSIDPFISHEQGKAHRKAQTACLQPKDPNLSGPLKPRKLNEPRNIFTEGSLEEMLDDTDKTAIGLQFTYKEVIDDETLYTCTLCEKERPVKRIKRDQMFKHVTNEFHIGKYLMIKFGYIKKGSAASVAVFEEAKNIEEFEGKIHREITDFTNQLPDEVKWPLKSKPGSSRERKTISPSTSNRSYSPPRSSRCTSPPRSSRCISPPRSSRYISPPRSSRDSNSPRSSRHSMSPRQRRRSRSPLSASPSSPMTCPPPPSIPVMVDKETFVKPSEFRARPIMEEIEMLPRPETQPESLEQLTEDPHMQGMLITALWALNSKVDKYYQQHKVTGKDVSNGNTVYLSGCANRIKENLCKLKLLESLDELSS